MDFKTIMIRMKGDPVSEAYASYCAESWRGFDLRFYNAITPERLTKRDLGTAYNKVKFGTRGNGRKLTETEAACFFSQYFLWMKSAVENIPILVLEHDAYLVKPEFIKFDPRFEVTFYGQHSMEAVMYNPVFAKRLIRHIHQNRVTGPMNLVDQLLGFFNKGTQSRHALPHARFIGQGAPVKSVIDPNIGTSVDHDGSTADRLKKDADLFKIVNLKKSGHYT